MCSPGCRRNSWAFPPGTPYRGLQESPHLTWRLGDGEALEAQSRPAPRHPLRDGRPLGTEPPSSQPCPDAFRPRELGWSPSLSGPLFPYLKSGFGGQSARSLVRSPSGVASCCHCAQWGAVPRPSSDFEPRLLTRPGPSPKKQGTPQSPGGGPLALLLGASLFPPTLPPAGPARALSPLTPAALAGTLGEQSSDPLGLERD